MDPFALQNQSAVLSRLKDELLATKYTGWSDFQRNIFWLAVVCGSLILLHVLLLLFLRWRIKTPLHGALSFPRFELFLLILALPAVCQASAFVIRGPYTDFVVSEASEFVPFSSFSLCRPFSKRLRSSQEIHTSILLFRKLQSLHLGVR